MIACQVSVGLHCLWRLVNALTAYLSQGAGAFDSLCFPEHVQFAYRLSPRDERPKRRPGR
jgi:hypothetical protein